MSERNIWSRIDTQDLAVVRISCPCFDDLDAPARNAEFACALRVLAAQIESPNSIFKDREIDDIKLIYDHPNAVMAAEVTLVRGG
jgi:hypothetical protein